jgi:hypothetical protein
MQASIRQPAFILCSNCSNIFNKVLIIIDGYLLSYFLELGVSLVLAQYTPHMDGAFH